MNIWEFIDIKKREYVSCKQILPKLRLQILFRHLQMKERESEREISPKNK